MSGEKESVADVMRVADGSHAVSVAGVHEKLKENQLKSRRKVIGRIHHGVRVRPGETLAPPRSPNLGGAALSFVRLAVSAKKVGASHAGSGGLIRPSGVGVIRS